MAQFFAWAIFVFRLARVNSVRSEVVVSCELSLRTVQRSSHLADVP